MEYPNFIGGGYEAQSLNVDAQQCINFYPEVVESSGAKSRMILLGTPGLVEFAELPTGPVRALWGSPSSERMFVVAGSKLYEVDSSGTPINGLGGNDDRGDVGDDVTHSPAQIFVNGGQLMVVSAGLAYIDDGVSGPQQLTYLDTLEGTLKTDGTTLVEWVSGDEFVPEMLGETITIDSNDYEVLYVISNKHLLVDSIIAAAAERDWEVDLTLKAKTGALLDGYFAVCPPESKRWWISELRDGNQWSAIEFGVKEGYPDNINAIFATNREMWLLGDETIEVNVNTGNADFPFQRSTSGYIQRGLGAAWSVAKLGGGIAWLDNTKESVTAFVSRGLEAERISTHAVEHEWRQYTSIADAIGFSYEFEGHEFWWLYFPSGNATWVYDLTTRSWHRRAYGEDLDAHLGRTFVEVFSRQFVGSRVDGKIYQLSAEALDDDGDEIHSIRSAPYLSDGLKQTAHHWFQLDMETGEVDEPEVYLSWSDDNGRSWSTERMLTAGESADYTARVMWRRLGKSRNRAYRVRIAAPMRKVLLGVDLGLGLGAH